MARSMLPYRRERKLVSQPPTPDGSMAVIKVNLVTSAAFHNDGRARGSSKVTSHSKWVDTGLHCPWHRFPHTSANHDNSPAASTEVSAGICGPERIALINPYGPPGRYSDRDARVWRSVRPLLHTCERAWRRRQHRQAAGTPAPRVNEGLFCPNLRCRSRLGGLLLAAPTNVWPGLFSVRRDTGFVAA
jgi:hypothetical protein